MDGKIATSLEEFIPVLADSVTIHNVDEGRFVLRDGERGTYIELTRDEAILAQLIDGKRTAEDIFVQSYEFQSKVPLVSLLSLLRKLGSSGTLNNSMEELQSLDLMGEEDFTLNKPTLWRKLTNWGIYIDGGSQFVQSITHPFVGLFLLIIGMFYGVLGFIAKERAWVGEEIVMDVGDFGAFLVVLIALSFTLSFRELIKGSILNSCGGRVWRFGLAFYFIIPYFATDRRDRLICTKRGRALIALSGITSCLALILLGVTLEDRTTGLLPLFGTTLSIVASILLFMNMSPLFGGDFHELVSSLSEGDAWHKRAISYLRTRFIIRLFSLGDTFKGERLFIAVTLYAIFWLYFLFVIIGGLYRNYGREWLSDFPSATGLDKAAIIIGLALLTIAGVGGFLTLVGAVIAALSSPIVAPWRRIAMKPKIREVQSVESSGAGIQELAKIPLFTMLSDIELKALSEVIQVEKFKAGDYIIRQGDKGDKFYSVRKGSVAVIVEDETGYMKQVATLGGGDGFGEIALLSDTPRTAHIRANDDVELFSLERTVFKTFAQSRGISAETMTDLLRRSQFLKSINLFRDLAADVLMTLSTKLTVEKFGAGSEIVREGEEGDKFYIIQEGDVEVLKATSEGCKRVAELKAGDYFGEIALIKNVPRTATVKAKSDVRLLSLTHSDFIRILGADFRLAAGLDKISDERLAQHSGIES
ncbi:MAG: hypothetical protein Kow0090_07250 [Myxococcota bacterium]